MRRSYGYSNSGGETGGSDTDWENYEYGSTLIHDWRASSDSSSTHVIDRVTGFDLTSIVSTHQRYGSTDYIYRNGGNYDFRFPVVPPNGSGNYGALGFYVDKLVSWSNATPNCPTNGSSPEDFGHPFRFISRFYIQSLLSSQGFVLCYMCTNNSGYRGLAVTLSNNTLDVRDGRNTYMYSSMPVINSVSFPSTYMGESARHWVNAIIDVGLDNTIRFVLFDDDENFFLDSGVLATHLQSTYASNLRQMGLFHGTWVNTMTCKSIIEYVKVYNASNIEDFQNFTI